MYLVKNTNYDAPRFEISFTLLLSPS